MFHTVLYLVIAASLSGACTLIVWYFIGQTVKKYLWLAGHYALLATMGAFVGIALRSTNHGNAMESEHGDKSLQGESE